jgi:hypothetical protein
MTTIDCPIVIDTKPLDQRSIAALTHRLCGHPLLNIGALVELGQRLEARKLVNTHSDEAGAGSPFGDAPTLPPNRCSAAETLSWIADAHAWTSQLNVQCDPVYRRLVDEVLDAIKPMVDRHDPGMRFRGGWIFVSMPSKAPHMVENGGEPSITVSTVASVSPKAIPRMKNVCLSEPPRMRPAAPSGLRSDALAQFFHEQPHNVGIRFAEAAQQPDR